MLLICNRPSFKIIVKKVSDFMLSASSFEAASNHLFTGVILLLVAGVAVTIAFKWWRYNQRAYDRTAGNVASLVTGTVGVGVGAWSIYMIIAAMGVLLPMILIVGVLIWAFCS